LEGETVSWMAIMTELVKRKDGRRGTCRGGWRGSWRTGCDVGNNDGTGVGAGLSVGTDEEDENSGRLLELEKALVTGSGIHSD
jgi:hypothetical protein